MPRRLGDLQVPAHHVEFLAGREEFVALGELADDLIRRVPPALFRCHVVAHSSCPNTGQQSPTTTGPLQRAHLTTTSGSPGPLLCRGPLRTARASFPAHGSSKPRRRYGCRSRAASPKAA